MAGEGICALSFLNPDILDSLVLILWLALYNACPPPRPSKKMISISMEIRQGLKRQRPTWMLVSPGSLDLPTGWLVLSFSYRPHVAGWAAYLAVMPWAQGLGNKWPSLSFLLKVQSPSWDTEHEGYQSPIHSEPPNQPFLDLGTLLLILKLLTECTKKHVPPCPFTYSLNRFWE